MPLYSLYKIFVWPTYVPLERVMQRAVLVCMFVCSPLYKIEGVFTKNSKKNLPEKSGADIFIFYLYQVRWL